jgi:nucleoside-diphosphate-sugar epimerase
MQTILGASGQIGRELAIHLKRDFTSRIRLVSRRPQEVNDTDQLVTADLLDAGLTRRAVEGSEIAYLTVGLPMDTRLWAEQWPILMRNAIDACAAHHAKLVFFDNTYMYPQTSKPQTEETAFVPNGNKGKVRTAIARALLDAMKQGHVQVMICRAPEFYGPGKTQSITNSMIIERLKSGTTTIISANSTAKRVAKCGIPAGSAASRSCADREQGRERGRRAHETAGVHCDSRPV